MGVSVQVGKVARKLLGQGDTLGQRLAGSIPCPFCKAVIGEQCDGMEFHQDRKYQALKPYFECEQLKNDLENTRWNRKANTSV